MISTATMKATISRKQLVELIGRIQSVVAPKPAIPALGNLLIEAANDELIISVTDLTISMRIFMDATVDAEGAIALPARRSFQLLRELTTSDLTIECGAAEIAHIHAGSSQFKMNGMHKSEFPDFPDMGEGKAFCLKSKELHEMLSKTSFACARDDSRHVLNGLLMEIANGNLTFIGTDGKRLAKIFAPLPDSTDFTTKMILPLKAVEEMNKILDLDEEAKLTIYDDRVALEVGHATLITKLIAGDFPDVERVIPAQDQAKKIILHREELMTLLRQTALFTSDTVNSVRLHFSDGEVELFAASGEIGEGKVSMPADYHGEKIEVAFNPHVLLNILRHLSGETFTFSLIDAFNPGLLTGKSNALFVVMPMRLN